MTISEIRDILKQETVEKTVLEEIMADERKGVRQLVDAYIRRLNRESAERFRVEDMYEPESSFYKKGLEYDETIANAVKEMTSFHKLTYKFEESDTTIKNTFYQVLFGEQE